MGSSQTLPSVHVLYYGRGVSGNVFANMACNGPGKGIVTSPGLMAHDKEDALAPVKLFTQSCDRGTNKKGKANDKFNQALEFFIHNFLSGNKKASTHWRQTRQSRLA
jgi:hypothetical protein